MSLIVFSFVGLKKSLMMYKYSLNTTFEIFVLQLYVGYNLNVKSLRQANKL